MFQLAPYILIGGTSYAYPYHSLSGAFIIALPGYSYTPPVEEGLEPSSVSSRKAPGAPVASYRIPKTFTPAPRYVKAPYSIMPAGRVELEKVSE